MAGRGGSGKGCIPGELVTADRRRQRGDRNRLARREEPGLKTSAQVSAARCCHSESQSKQRVNVVVAPAEGSWEATVVEPYGRLPTKHPRLREEMPQSGRDRLSWSSDLPAV